MPMKHRTLVEEEFAEPGATIEGKLLQVKPIRYRDGGTNAEYLLKRTDGKIVTFKGSSMLNKLIFPDDVGALVRITFRGNDGKPVADGMSARKIFEVEVDEDSKPKLSSHPKPATTDGTEITDDDIPF